MGPSPGLPAPARAMTASLSPHLLVTAARAGAGRFHAADYSPPNFLISSSSASVSSRGTSSLATFELLRVLPDGVDDLRVGQCGDDTDVGEVGKPRMCSRSASRRPGPNRLSPGREVSEQVHVTTRVVFAAGHAAEHAQVTDPMRCGSGDQVLEVAAYPAAHRT
jgi:hypothetical protein